MTFALNTMRRAMFDRRIRQIRAVFRAACAPFHQELEEIEQEADDFQRRVDANNAQWEDYMMRRPAPDGTMAKSSANAATRLRGAPLGSKGVRDRHMAAAVDSPVSSAASFLVDSFMKRLEDQKTLSPRSLSALRQALAHHKLDDVRFRSNPSEAPSAIERTSKLREIIKR